MIFMPEDKDKTKDSKTEEIKSESVLDKKEEAIVNDTEEKKPTDVKESEDQPKAKKEEDSESLDAKKKKYLKSVGRRKTSIAQVRIYTKGEGDITINEKDLDKYFPTYVMQHIVRHPLKLIGQDDKAVKIFDDLIASAKPGPTVEFFAKFGEKQAHNIRTAANHYKLGLGHLGKGMKTEAKAAFEKALELNINHLWAKVHLSDL